MDTVIGYIKQHGRIMFLFTLAYAAFFSSCSTLDKASMHGFSSGYYTLKTGKKAEKVYVDVAEGEVGVYHEVGGKPSRDRFLSIPLQRADSVISVPMKFTRKSLDIDLTTVLLKYRPSVYGLPPQLTADLNVALYAGLRHDSYKLLRKTDPLGNHYHKISNFGYDFGFFAGPGITAVNPFTTNNRTTNEYSGMVVQMGFAGFLESNIASFGIAVGFDHLLNRDRAIWIYNSKPYVGFVVGIALN